MRIIAGDFRKRRLQGPPDSLTTRPISDLVKEALFNILRGHPEDGAVFDCFAGTGSIGLEALSRGSPRCVFVERDRRMAEILRANIEHCQAGDRAEVVVGDALGPGALSRCPRPVHLIFFDPPYAMVRDQASWSRVKGQLARAIALLDDTGYAVLRTPWPFLHLVEEPPTPEEPELEGRRARGKRGERASRRSPEPRGRRRRHEEDADFGPASAGAWGGEPEQTASEEQRVGGAVDDQLGADEMEEIEIDLSTPEGQALMRALTEGGAIEIDERGRPVGEAPPSPGQPARPPLIQGDLSIPGAIGPETHAYAGMAVHLYMKQRGPGAEPATPANPPPA